MTTKRNTLLRLGEAAEYLYGENTTATRQRLARLADTGELRCVRIGERQEAVPGASADAPALRSPSGRLAVTEPHRSSHRERPSMTTEHDPTLSRYADTQSDTLRDALLTISPKQRAALDALATGATHADAADAAKVTRETVTRWLNHHPAFRTAYAAQCSALAAEAVEQARAIRAKASGVVLAKLDGADLPTALAALRAVGPAPATTELGTQTAPALLDQARTVTGMNSPAPPRPRGDGLADLMEQIDGTREVAEWERVDRLTLTRLADASGIDPDEIDRPTPSRRRRRPS